MTWCCALPSSNGAGGEEEEHTLFCYPPAAGNGADLKADRLSKYHLIGMKTHEVQISFCTGHLHKSSRAPVPFRWVSLFLPDTLMPNKPRCLQSPALYAAKLQKFHKITVVAWWPRNHPSLLLNNPNLTLSTRSLPKRQ